MRSLDSSPLKRPAMSTRGRFLPVTVRRLAVTAVFAAGLYATFIRFTKGLGAATALSDQYPWGLWIGFDVLCGVGLAAGGFTLATVVYVFHLERFAPIVRPAILTAFLGYALVAVALLYDLGRPERIWHPLVMWNPRSVMFEVAWCVVLYLLVLGLELSPGVFEQLRLRKVATILKSVTVPLVIVGVLLSILHQSSLGALYVIVPTKLHPYWYSPLLPLFFLLSAIGVGLAMVIFESNLSARAFGRQLEQPLLAELGKALAVVLGIYVVLWFQDLVRRGAYRHLREPSVETVVLLLEIALGIAAPMVLLSMRKVREDSEGLYVSAVLVIAGFLLNRLNVSITGMEAAGGAQYFPKWTEVAVTLAMVSLGCLLFRAAVRHLNIFESPPQPPVSEQRSCLTNLARVQAATSEGNWGSTCEGARCSG